MITWEFKALGFEEGQVVAFTAGEAPASTFVLLGVSFPFSWLIKWMHMQLFVA